MKKKLEDKKEKPALEKKYGQVLRTINEGDDKTFSEKSKQISREQPHQEKDFIKQNLNVDRELTDLKPADANTLTKQVKSKLEKEGMHDQIQTLIQMCLEEKKISGL